MDPEERREAIIEAALPLVAEHGANVATRRIAQAAGIAEGTVFRVFTNKEELLRACVTEALRLDRVQAQVRDVRAGGPVEDRLVEVAVLVGAHFARLSELMHTLATSGYDPRHRDHGAAKEGPRDFVGGLRATIVSKLEPDADQFEIAVDELASLVLGLIMSQRFDPPGADDLRNVMQRRVGVLLHGALRADAIAARN